MFVMTIQLLYTQSVVLGLSPVIVHEPHLCVQQLYDQYKHTIVHEPHLCAQQLYGQYQHVIVHEPHLCAQQLYCQSKYVIVHEPHLCVDNHLFVLTIQLLYTHVWFMD
jgi:hypothetical protein